MHLDQKILSLKSKKITIGDLLCDCGAAGWRGSDRQLLCNVIPVDISDQRSVAVRRDKAGLGLTPGPPAARRVFIHLHPAPVLALRGFRSGWSDPSLHKPGAKP